MMMPSVFGNNFFDEMMSFPWEREFFRKNDSVYQQNAGAMMRTDIKETDGSYEVTIDLPGFKKEDVNASLKNGYLTIQAATNVNHDQKDENGKYIRRERYSGSCSRSFYVGEGVKEEDVKAKFEDGILKLSVAKKDSAIEEKKGYIAIEG